MKRNSLIAMAALGWWFVALVLGADRLRGFGDAALVVLAFAAVPNLMVWRRLHRFETGKVWAIAFASSYVLMNAWNAGLRDEFMRWRLSRTLAGYAVEGEADARAREARLTPTYRANVQKELGKCQQQTSLCRIGAQAYRRDGDYDAALQLYQVCCGANETACCDEAAEMQDARTKSAPAEPVK